MARAKDRNVLAGQIYTTRNLFNWVCGRHRAEILESFLIVYLTE